MGVLGVDANEFYMKLYEFIGMATTKTTGSYRRCARARCYSHSVPSQGQYLYWLLHVVEGVETSHYFTLDKHPKLLSVFRCNPNEP